MDIIIGAFELHISSQSIDSILGACLFGFILFGFYKVMMEFIRD